MDCCDNLKKMFLVCVLLFYLLCTCDAKVIEILKKEPLLLKFSKVFRAVTAPKYDKTQ